MFYYFQVTHNWTQLRLLSQFNIRIYHREYQELNLNKSITKAGPTSTYLYFGSRSKHELSTLKSHIFNFL